MFSRLSRFLVGMFVCFAGVLFAALAGFANSKNLYYSIMGGSFEIALFGVRMATRRDAANVQNDA
jgi:hypothetical protein